MPTAPLCSATSGTRGARATPVAPNSGLRARRGPLRSAAKRQRQAALPRPLTAVALLLRSVCLVGVNTALSAAGRKALSDGKYARAGVGRIKAPDARGRRFADRAQTVDLAARPTLQQVFAKAEASFRPRRLIRSQGHAHPQHSHALAWHWHSCHWHRPQPHAQHCHWHAPHALPWHWR